MAFSKQWGEGIASYTEETHMGEDSLQKEVIHEREEREGVGEGKRREKKRREKRRTEELKEKREE